jgi:hypothetical protein
VLSCVCNERSFLQADLAALCRGPCRLTEHTLDACQTKRQRSDQVAVELRYICRHLQQWQLLGKELTLQVGRATAWAQVLLVPGLCC